MTFHQVNPHNKRSIYPDDFEESVLLYCVKRKALSKDNSKEQHKVLKIFVGESDLSILELKKEVINEKFKSVHILHEWNGKQSSLSWVTEFLIKRYNKRSLKLP